MCTSLTCPGRQVDTKLDKKVGRPKHEYWCPDCGFPLEKRSVRRRYFCDNPECLMIFGVAPHRGDDREGFTRITRAAVPMEPHQRTHV